MGGLVRGGGDGNQFFERGIASDNLLPRTLTHGNHAFFCGLGAQRGNGGAAGDEILHGVGDGADFHNSHTPAVAGAAAFPAADRRQDVVLLRDREAKGAEIAIVVLVFFRRCAAVRAEPADEALGEKGAHRGSDQKRLNSHVQQTGDASHGVIGVQGAENEVTGEGAADGDFRGLEVTHFSYHDHIGVAPQDAAQAGGKGEINLRLYRDLDHPVEFIFHRVFNGDNAPVLGVQFAEEGVEGAGFSAAGGTGHEDNAIGQGQQFTDAGFKGRAHAETTEVEPFPA